MPIMKILTTRLETRLAGLLAIVSLTTVLVLAAAAFGDPAGELREEFHHTYPLAANGRVSLHNVSGTVRITAWDRNEVRVDAVKRAERRERLAEAEIKVESTADSIRIWTRYPDRDTRITGDEKNRYDNAASVDYTLSVPRGARLDSVELVNGSLDITGVAGDVRASTVSGRFKATGLAGEAKLSTVSASLDASFDRLSELKPVTLNSVSGAIVLTLPSDAQAQVRANTLSGPITNDFGLDGRTGNYIGRELYGQLGKGGTKIRLNSVSGRITIQHAADGKPLSPATSLLAKQDLETVAGRIRLRPRPSEALLKAQRDAAQARAELRRVEREANASAQARTARALIDAERNVAMARAELQRIQGEANSEAQRAAAQALAEAEHQLADARRQSSVVQRERAQSLGEAQRQMALAEGELQRIQREEGETQAQLERELRKSGVEVQRMQREMQLKIQREMQLKIQREMQLKIQRDMQLKIQREMQLKIRRETQNKIRIKQSEVQRQSGEAVRAAARDTLIATGSGLRFRDSESKTFTVSGKPRVTIGTFDGRITIHAWDKNDVMYVATKRTAEESTLKGITLRSEHKGSDISIIANLDDASVHRVAGVKSINAYTSIEIYAPRNASIHASTGEGGISVEGITGEIELRNSAGSIVVSDSKGHLTVNAGNGQVRVSNFDGAVDARSGEGRVYLGGHFTQLSAQTNNQAIVLTLSPDTNAIIEANSESVVNEGLQATEESGSAQRIKRFKVGSGGPLFTLRSGTGRIILRRADTGPM
jgi:DUF4097 and DUF4098 domain-containing protein YvlB